jgi:hypothetical protein
MDASGAKLSCERLLGPREVFVASEVVTLGEQATLVAWAEEKGKRDRLLMHPRDPYNRTTPFLAADGGVTRLTRPGEKGDACCEGRPIWVPDLDARVMDPLPAAFWQIRARVIALLDIAHLSDDPYKGSFLSYIAPGGAVHLHRDARLTIDGEEFALIRCNVLFQRSETGGEPVIGTLAVDVPERGMWAFYPTEIPHSATEVGGRWHRGTLSFGFLVRLLDLVDRGFRVAGRGGAAAGIPNCSSPAAQAILAQAGCFSLRSVCATSGRAPADVMDAMAALELAGAIVSESSYSRPTGSILSVRS